VVVWLNCIATTEAINMADRNIAKAAKRVFVGCSSLVYFKSILIVHRLATYLGVCCSLSAATNAAYTEFLGESTVEGGKRLLSWFFM
jgi:hypothetical protein